MSRHRTRWNVPPDPLVKQHKTDGVALTKHQVTQGCGRKASISKFGDLPRSETHRSTHIKENVGLKVRLFFVFLHIDSIGLPIDFPVDIPNRIPRHISSVLGKFHGESMVGALV